jgi:hypothetical protein
MLHSPKVVLGACVFTWLYRFFKLAVDLNGEGNRVRKKKSQRDRRR